MVRRLIPVFALAVLAAGAAAPAARAADAHAHHHHPAPAGYARTVHPYAVPDVALVERAGQPVALRELLDTDKPLLVNFIYTSCTAICPVQTATFAQLRRRLGAAADGVRLVSISIDPEQDTPARLREYARRFQAGGDWHFLTGARGDALAVQRAFDAWRGDKSAHIPLVLLRAGAREPWVRLDGFTSAEELAREIERLRTL